MVEWEREVMVRILLGVMLGWDGWECVNRR